MDNAIRHDHDLGFTIVADPHEYTVDFKVYEMQSTVMPGPNGSVFSCLWNRAGAGAVPDHCDKLEDAEVYLHGNVKWDGCANWHFDEQDRVMLHTCGREAIMHISAVMALCWDWTAELCPQWEE
jgi:hypothetical protein